MQNEKTLIELGFYRYNEWDYESINIKAFRKDYKGKVFRAHEVSCNGPSYVSMGVVCTPCGKVNRWMDCCSFGSVERKIKAETMRK